MGKERERKRKRAAGRSVGRWAGNSEKSRLDLFGPDAHENAREQRTVIKVDLVAAKRRREKREGDREREFESNETRRRTSFFGTRF